ncbi:conserved protein of unknown function [Rhodococcus sp. RD6.2]|nr:conserved protein of unknown function [Rhodococcus sp. RD6.2]
MLADTIEHVFPWPTEFDPPPYRVVDPPVPVIVHIATAISQPAAHPATVIPLRVRAEGLALDVQVPGTLRAWARTTGSGWICCLCFTIPTGNGRGGLDVVDQWCPAAAVRPVK